MWYFFVDHLCYFCNVFVMLSRLFIAALWSPAENGLTSWLSFVVLNGVFVTFPCGILGQVWYLIVSIPDLWPLSYFSYVSSSNCYSKPFSSSANLVTANVYPINALKMLTRMRKYQETSYVPDSKDTFGRRW